MFKKFIFLLFASVSLATFAACSDDDNDNIHVDGKYTQALNSVKPGLTNVKWEREGVYSVAEGRENGYSVDVWFDRDAKWVMTETDYEKNVAAVPEAVQTAIANSQYTTQAVDDIDFYERPDVRFYVVEYDVADAPDVYEWYSPEGVLIQTYNTDVDITPTTPVSVPVN